ncbi:hypothetical protein Tco_1075347 [Tanacetum coccineum]
MALAITERSRRLHCIVNVEMSFFQSDSSQSDDYGETGQDLFDTSIVGSPFISRMKRDLLQLDVPGFSRRRSPDPKEESINETSKEDDLKRGSQMHSMTTQEELHCENAGFVYPKIASLVYEKGMWVLDEGFILL